MKKLFLVLFAFFALTVTAQEQTTTPTTSSYTPYVSVGLSMSNSNGVSFNESSYPSVELGVTRNNVSVGVVLGRGQLRGIGEDTDVLSEYFYEFKVSPSFNLGTVSGNVILGVGSYFDTSNAMFIEYGLGVSKSYGNLGVGLSYTNWNGTDYVTPSLTFSFN